MPVHTLIWKKLSFQGVEDNYGTVLFDRWHKYGVEKDLKVVAVSAVGVLYLLSFLIISEVIDILKVSLTGLVLPLFLPPTVSYLVSVLMLQVLGWRSFHLNMPKPQK